MFMEKVDDVKLNSDPGGGAMVGSAAPLDLPYTVLRPHAHIRVGFF